MEYEPDEPCKDTFKKNIALRQQQLMPELSPCLGKVENAHSTVEEPKEHKGGLAPQHGRAGK